MALVTTTQASLTGGVSQLLPSQRLETQGEAQDNAYASMVSGLHKRHPTEHVVQTRAKSNEEDLNREVHFIDRDESERYLVEINDDGVSPVIFDLTTGKEVNVFKPGTATNASNGTTPDASALSYCQLNSAGTNIQMLTIADYTLILNRDKTAAMKAATVENKTVTNMPDAVNVTYNNTTTDIRAASSRRKFIFVRSGNYDRTYAVRLTTIDKDGKSYPPTGHPQENSYNVTTIKTWKGTEAIASNGVDPQNGTEGNDRNGDWRAKPPYDMIGNQINYRGWCLDSIDASKIAKALLLQSPRPFFTSTGSTNQEKYGPWNKNSNTKGGRLFTASPNPLQPTGGTGTGSAIGAFTGTSDEDIFGFHSGGLFWTYNLRRDQAWDSDNGAWTNPASESDQSATAEQVFFGMLNGNLREGSVVMVELGFIDQDRNSLATATPLLYRDKIGIEVVEGINDGDLSVFGDEVDDISKLPLICRDGHRVKIAGDQASGADDYWVKFVADPSVLAARSESTAAWYMKYMPMPGTWEECSASAQLDTIDEDTMPHQLVRQVDSNGDSYFELGPVSWAQRQAGDDTTNPQPVFIGKQIESVFLHQNRLGFLAGSNVVMSEADNLFNPWRTTVTTTLDSDPISVDVGHIKVVSLRHAVPHAEKLVLFSDDTQFVLSGDPILSPSTVSVVPASDFEIDTGCNPVSSGRSVYFAQNRHGHSGVRELFETGSEGILIANDVTSHVPQYLKGRVLELAASSRNNVVVARLDGDPNALYVYKHHQVGNDRVQSAWMRFIIGSGSVVPPGTAVSGANKDERYVYIHGMSFIDEHLYMFVVRRSEGGSETDTCVERLSFDEPTTDEFPRSAPSTQSASAPSGGSGLEGGIAAVNDPTAYGTATAVYETLLDRRISEDQCAISYDSSSSRVIIQLPYLLETDLENGVTYSGFSGKLAKMRVITRKCAVASGLTADPEGVEYAIAGISVYDSLVGSTIGFVVHRLEISDPSLTLWGKLGGDTSNTSTPLSETTRTTYLWIGQDYKMSYEFTKPAVKQATGRGSRDIQTGRHQLLYGTLAIGDAVAFDVDVGPALDATGQALVNKDTITHSYTNLSVGIGGSYLGSVVPKTETFRFPVYSQTKLSRMVLRNDSPFSSKFLSAEWDASYTRRTALYRG